MITLEVNRTWTESNGNVWFWNDGCDNFFRQDFSGRAELMVQYKGNTYRCWESNSYSFAEALSPIDVNERLL